MGKGGVGKSTISSLMALCLARKGFKVLLISMDPAHNQSDIFRMNFTEKPQHVAENLLAKEVELEFWVKKYLADVEAQMKDTYRYLTAFNLEKHFNIIKYSPGIEEYALLLAQNDIQNKFKDIDYFVFDMPPTALTLKFFSLPELSLIWLEKLLKLRQEIIKKREIITKIKFGKKEIEQDKILNNLQKQIKNYQKNKELFEDQNKTHIYLVMNPDKLSLSESQLITRRLSELNFQIKQIIVNKYKNLEDINLIRETFSNIPIHLFKLSEYPLIGMAYLQKYLLEQGFSLQL